MNLQKTQAVLDIGSSQITCMVGSVKGHSPAETVNIKTVSINAAKGVEKGRIVNIQQARQSIEKCIESAEKKIGERITSMVACLAGSIPKSHWISKSVPVASKKVSDSDIAKLLDVCKKASATEDAALLHVTPCNYFVDTVGTRNPKGLIGKTLEGRVHMTTCDTFCLQNLTELLDVCSIEKQDIVVTGLASSLGVMDEEEYKMSTIVIDLGGGATSIAVFFKGTFVYAKNILLGGQHITNDIVSATSASVAEAERIKIKYGSAMVAQCLSPSTVIEYYRAGEKYSNAHLITKKELSTIINRRLEQIFDKIDTALKDFTFASRLIVTGGGAHMENIDILATQKLKRKVRTGKPINTFGLKPSYRTGRFSSAVGLLRYSSSDKYNHHVYGVLRQARSHGDTLLKRLYNWWKYEI